MLFKFLDYYASFDWDSYCVTVNGPVPISSLPDMPCNDAEVVLNEKFFRECIELYSVPTKAVEANGHYFPVKHFNIVDPLKHSNNLGCSVTKGNLPIDAARVQNIKLMICNFIRQFATYKACFYSGS